MGARGPLKLPPYLQPVREGEVSEQTAQAVIKPSRPVRPRGLPVELHPLWDEIVDALDNAGLIASCDGPTLELALRHYLVARRASNALMRQAVTQEDRKNKRTMKHPASQVFRDHSTAFLEYAKQLGLTFVARARTPIDDKGAGANGGNPFAAGSTD